MSFNGFKVEWGQVYIQPRQQINVSFNLVAVQYFSQRAEHGSFALAAWSHVCQDPPAQSREGQAFQPASASSLKFSLTGIEST